MHFLSDKPLSPNNPADFKPTLNGIVYVVCKTLRNIMASAAEAELGALFLKGQEAVPIRITLEEMGQLLDILGINPPIWPLQQMP